MPAIITQHAMTILSAAVWWLLITGVGLLCLRMLSIRTASRGEALFVSFGIGLVIVGYSVFFLAIAGALQPILMAVMLLSLALLSLAGWLRLTASQDPMPIQAINLGFRLFKFHPVKSHFDSGHQVELIAGIVLLLLLAAAFLLTLAPETGKDALIYHLAVPKLYLKHGGYYFITGNIFADYPLLAEMHYLIALFVGNDVTAKAMNYVVLCEILAGIYLFTRLILINRGVSTLAMLIFLSIPSVFAVSHTAYNDLFVAFFTLGAFYAFMNMGLRRLNRAEELQSGWVIIFGIFTAGAVACKYTALLIIPLGCIGILFFAHRDKLTAWAALKTLFIFGAAALLAGSPFYLKNWFVTGNPFHPFLYSIFGGLGWDADQARIYDMMVQNLGMGRTFLDYLLLPFNLSFRAKMDSIAFDGVIGPLFFVALPFVTFVRRDITVSLILVFSFFSFLFWASSAQQIRYLIHLFPLLAIVVGAIVSGSRGKKIVYPLLLLLIGGSLACNAFHIARDFNKISPMRVVAGLESREAFLSRTVPVYPMYRFANENLPADAKIFLIYMKNYTFFCERDCYSDSMFETHTIGKILRQFSTPEDIAAALKKGGFTHLMVDIRYLAGPMSPLSTKEQERFARFRNQCLTNIASSGPRHLCALCR
jgi:hypothetical protein